MEPQGCTIGCAVAQMECLNCNFASYCSIECATTDESLHSQFCAVYKTFLSTPRPTTSHHIGLLFPTVGPPTFFWATTRPILHYNMGSVNLEPQLQDVLHTPTNTFQSGVVGFDTYRNFDLGHNLGIYTSLPKDTTPNRFIEGFQVGKDSPTKFTGPVAVLAFDRVTSASEIPVPRDITLEDSRIAIDYFIHGDELRHYQLSSFWNRHGRANEVLGVKILYDAERDGDKFQVIKVPKDHPVFEKLSTPISVAMEMPLKMWIYHRINTAGGSGYHSLEASSLNRITDVTDSRWGEVPEEWNGEVGSILVVRQDGKDLKAGEMKALATFCTDVLDVMISQTKRRVGYSRECLVQEFMDRNTFELWLFARNSRMKRCGVDEGLLSPYDSPGREEWPVEDVEMTDASTHETTAGSGDHLKVIKKRNLPMPRNFAFKKLVLRIGGKMRNSARA
ncbi:hypothetical protein IFR05_011444 [Cadophora sp. M221]|nr:hypothetical protein IFR05_011444 [Cadophora sp. M221]